MPKKTMLDLKTRRDYLLIMSSIKEIGNELHMSNLRLSNLLTAASELMNNIFKYAGNGQVIISTGVIFDSLAIILSVIDQGPGIANIDLALKSGYSTKCYSGMGLPGVKEIVDDFQIRSKVGYGTTVTISQCIF